MVCVEDKETPTEFGLVSLNTKADPDEEDCLSTIFEVEPEDDEGKVVYSVEPEPPSLQKEEYEDCFEQCQQCLPVLEQEREQREI